MTDSALPRPTATRPPAGVLRAYLALCKPRIIELLLVVTVPAMVLAQRGLPPLGLVASTLVGGAAAAGSANAFNCYLDRDIDRVMHRTRHRPLVTGAVSDRGALAFAWALGVFAVVWLAGTTNAVAALLALAAILVYVVGYTMVLKRRTPQNIVWGGTAGCVPVLIGWSAVTGSLGWGAWVLFAVVFFWTPAHYWPLSVQHRADYAAAGVPMLPVVAGDVRVSLAMLAHAAAMVACSLLLWPVAGLSWAYGAAALLLGAWFLRACVAYVRRADRRAGGPAAPMRVFSASITYLALLFAAVAADVLVMG